MSHQHAVSGRIARSTGILAVATALSRLLGFVRDILLATLFGTSLQAQAFVVAFRVPNLLRDLVAEGAVTSAFVPVLSWYQAKGHPQEFWQLSQTVFTQLCVVVVALGVLGSWAAPWIVRVIAPGFVADPEKFSLTVRLTRILFPFITLVGLWAYFMGLLNTLRHFSMPALGPAILNAAMIVGCLIFVPRTTPGIVAVAISVIIGGVIQLLIQLPVAMRLGFRWHLSWTHPGSGEVLRLLAPRTIGSAVYQADVMIDTILASMGSIVGDGAVAAIYFANRLVQLPLALFGTASAQASLPLLAEQAAHQQMGQFRSTLLSIIRMVGFVTLPSSIGLMVLAFPIVGGLFERGAFHHAATVMTAQALVCYAIGLFAYSISKVITGAFYALHDTWTSVKLAAEALVIGAVLSVVLMFPLKVVGLALAAVLSNTFNAYRLLQQMERRLAAPIMAAVVSPLLRMTAASVVMGVGSGLLWRSNLAHLRVWLGLPLAIVASLILYASCCWLFRVHELSTVTRWIAKLPLFQLFASE